MPGCWALELSMRVPPEVGVRCLDMIGQKVTYLQFPQAERHLVSYTVGAFNGDYSSSLFCLLSSQVPR